MSPQAVSMLAAGGLTLVLLGLAVWDELRFRHPRWPRRDRRPPLRINRGARR